MFAELLQVIQIKQLYKHLSGWLHFRSQGIKLVFISARGVPCFEVLQVNGNHRNPVLLTSEPSWRVELEEYLGIVALRVLLLGQSWAVWWHQLGSGALLLFAFFMISDPMTIPNRPGARVAYAIVVAMGAAAWQYILFKPNALIWALFLLTPAVPLLDRLFPGERFDWRSPNPG